MKECMTVDQILIGLEVIILLVCQPFLIHSTITIGNVRHLRPAYVAALSVHLRGSCSRNQSANNIA